MPKIDTKTDKIRAERAERFFYMATKIEMSLTDLILHIYGNRKKILDFLGAVKSGKKNDIKNIVKDLLSIFPLPKILELSEEDVYSLILNRLTKNIRNEIEKQMLR